MLTLQGTPALSQTKLALLLKTLRSSSPSVTSISSTYIHLIDTSSPEAETLLSTPSSKERTILDALLKYGDESAQVAPPSSSSSEVTTTIWVVPRLGTLSPWSSKATDISRMCNLAGVVNRIERGIVFTVVSQGPLDVEGSFLPSANRHLHDRMTQTLLLSPPSAESIFARSAPGPLKFVPILPEQGQAVADSTSSPMDLLLKANTTLGLALSPPELNYLLQAYLALDPPRNPTDVELFMFAQVNSEHCRHKIFNATWTIDGVEQDNSLFGMIRNTEKLHSEGTISAYSDNAAVLDSVSSHIRLFTPNPTSDSLSTAYSLQAPGKSPILIKVETHNHPTAVSPFSGASTGSGGEIRDEGAVGRGSKPKMGLAGFMTSDLNLEGFRQPWEETEEDSKNVEKAVGKPEHVSSAREIMIAGPLGSSAFNNEFGRPGLTGFWRTFSLPLPSTSSTSPDAPLEVRGYHKPIMLAGGLGTVRPSNALKQLIPVRSHIIVLGGPGMLIGLGGGAASSMTSGASTAELDFASVQRENPEMQRRCQMVIDACTSLVESSGGNPIASIHDVGAGGLSNALPELVHDSDLGGRFEIRDVLVDDGGMSPMEIWCNESQERYVLAIAPTGTALATFEAICKRERCPYSIVGVATSEQELVVTDRLLGSEPIHLAMSTLFGKPPKLVLEGLTVHPRRIEFDPTLASYLPGVAAIGTEGIIGEAVKRVMHLPSVGSKSYLITIGDRTISGLVTRDQMVGPWQVPVADVAVTRASYGFDDVLDGEAMALGERTPLALLSPAASARMAVVESLTNLAAASIESIEKIKLSANWMSPASHPGEAAGLYEAVKAIGMELCPALGVGIPVGKDSMSMKMKWNNQRGDAREVTSPVSVVITAFAPVKDVSLTWTPQLRTDVGPTVLVFVDLAGGKQRLGGSSLAQVFKQIGSTPPDVEDPKVIKSFFAAVQTLKEDHAGTVLAYHDRSDGGLLATITEMCFAGRVGAEIDLDELDLTPTSDLPIAALFNEELGAVFQVAKEKFFEFTDVLDQAGFPHRDIHVVGKVNNAEDQTISILHHGKNVYSSSRGAIQQMWAETSFKMQESRDDPVGARQEFDDILLGPTEAGLTYNVTAPFLPLIDTPSCPSPLAEASETPKPKVAILREQGVNGHVEMAFAFAAAGFEAVDVHMSDIIGGTVTLDSFRGIAACGGFSYGDVLGAGNGWAKSILLNDRARSQFSNFFTREDTFGLGVCNGCQFFAQLREIIPGSEAWPTFKRNTSEVFEGRVALVKIESTPGSVFFNAMDGTILPIAVAHGEGKAVFGPSSSSSEVIVPLRYVDHSGTPTERYPLNPNGSPEGIAAVQSSNGRVLAIMPHPERNVALETSSWFPESMRGESGGGMGPWFRIFQNARSWVDENSR